MDNARTVVNILKVAGATVWKNIEYQMIPKSVRECENVKESLKGRMNDIEGEVQLQRQVGPEKVAKKEVADWLEKVKNATETDAEDLMKKGGCFCSSSSNTSRAKQADERAQELMMLLKEGEEYINAGVILVQDDQSIVAMIEFQKLKEGLRQQKEDVETIVREQPRSGKIVNGRVRTWLAKVQSCLERTPQDEGSSGGGELKKLLDEGKSYIDGDAIFFEDGRSGGVLFDIPAKCYGIDTTLAAIVECLKKDEVRRVAVCGMAGVGKKTIMKHVHNHFIKECTFDKIIWVTVSIDFNIPRLQDEIAYVLTGRPLEERDARRRAAMISMLLGQGNYFLILLDVWKPIVVDEVGISCGFGNKNCFKLALTTRSRDVARAMECDEIFQLEHLSHENALQLFLDNVGPVVLSQDGNIRPDLESTVMEIVEECHGLPLAIVAMGHTMKGMTDHRYSWFEALKQLREGKIAAGGEMDIMGSFKFNYDQLEDKKLQDCFLYCALYPEGFEIPKEELIELWIKEGYINQMETRYEMICEGYEILKKLQDKSLLECIESEDSQNDDDRGQWRIAGLDFGGSYGRVKMHNLLRDMALNISRKSHRCILVTRASLTEREWEQDLEKVSLTWNDMEEIPLPRTHLRYNMLTTMLMPDNKISGIPEHFFQQMPGLRILDLSRNKRLRRLPGSISDLEYLTTLLLRDCYSLREVPTLVKCQRLTKLDLCRTGIQQLPEGMEMLINLNYLDVRYTKMRKVPGGILPNLSKLQYLFVDEMEAEEEVLALRKLEYLRGTVGSWDNTSILLRFMQNQGKRLIRWKEPLLTLFLRRRKISFLLYLKNELELGDLYTATGRLDEDIDLRCIGRILIEEVLSLQSLSIVAMVNLECVFCLGFNPLKSLTILKLVSLEKLKSVFDEDGLGPVSYSSYPLNSIIIWGCPALKKLFPSALLLGCLQNLEHIEVTYCEGMEEIVSEEESEQKLNLPQLTTLKLNNLPALKSICCSSTVLMCDSLETLEIIDCKKLKRIPLVSPQLSTPLSLGKIMVDSEEWWSFSEWCYPNAKDILYPLCSFFYKALELTLPKLRTLQLNQLPELEHICSTDSGLICESLDTVEVTNCEKLERIPLFLSQLEGGATQPSTSHSRRNLTLDSGKWQRSSSSSSQLPHLNSLLSKYDFSFDDSDEEEEEDSEKEEANSNESPSSGSHNAIKAADQNQ